MLLLVPSRLELEKLVPEAAHLEEPCVWPGRVDAAGGEIVVARCGVGLALAGINATEMLQRVSPASVLLAGLAGSFDEARAAVGSLVVGSSVGLHGIGVGEGPQHRSILELGGALAGEAESAAGELALQVPPVLDAPSLPLLSVAAGAAGDGDAQERRRRHPDCAAEDMESWSVARASQLAAVPCTVLRGISNVAGDRDHAAWRVDEAIAALRAALESLSRAKT